MARLCLAQGARQIVWRAGTLFLALTCDALAPYCGRAHKI